MKVGYSYLTEQFGPQGDKMRVKYIELGKGFNVEATLNAIREELKECQFTLGPEVAEFEGKFANLCGAKHAIGVNSGTDALFLSLKALGVGPGDEVITAPNSFIASAGAIAQTGATPTFADVADDYNIDPSKLEGSITPRTKAILPVHLTGNPANMPAILKIAAKHNLHVVEDAAQAISAAIDGKPVGSFGDAGGFSMHPLKNLNVWGDGGVTTTNSDEVDNKIRLLRNHGLKNRDEVEVFGYNSRLDTVQAIVALNLIKEIEAITNTRIANAAFYDKALADLKDYVQLPPRKKNVRQVYHTYVIQVERRDQLLKHLEDNGVEAKVHYPVPIHLQKACQAYGYKKGAFPVCEAQTQRILTLPVHQHLSQDQLAYVAETIHKFYGH